jgi:chromosome segregation ATPase
MDIVEELRKCTHGQSKLDYRAAREIESLRQQADTRDRTISNYESKVPKLEEQLALRELEIVRLREALNKVVDNTYAARDILDALSTTFTPDHLNEWLKEQLESLLDSMVGVNCEYHKEIVQDAVKEIV